MAQEIELKLRIESSEDLSEALLERFALNSLQESDLRNIYFDTLGLALNKRKVALRIRTDKRRYIQTLKTKGQSIDGLHQRGEWEWNLPSDALDVHQLKMCDGWPESLDVNGLVPVFETNFIRKSAELIMDNTVIELAYDRGHVISKGLSKPIHELELEIKQGEASKLLHLKDALALAFDVTPYDVSKAETGYALYATHQQ